MMQDQRTDGRTVRWMDGQREGRTRTIIEMHSRISVDSENTSLNKSLKSLISMPMVAISKAAFGL